MATTPLDDAAAAAANVLNDAVVDNNNDNDYDDDGTTTTYIIFGIITLIIYFFFLRPFLASDNTQATTPTAAATTAARQQQQQQTNNTRQQQQQDAWPQSTRKPSHATKIDATLVDGVISFRHCTAATHEKTNNNRKDRAKLLSRLVSTPPSRGTTVVVSIPADDVHCQSLRRILYLLATYFNVIVIISLVVDTGTTTQNDDTIDELVMALYGNDNELAAVLPKHRIIAAQSRMGRIAVVRQLGKRVEIVLDFEAEIKDELSRFGFNVFVYSDDNTKPTNGVSRLAAKIMD